MTNMKPFDPAQLKAALLDMDGTLYESMSYHTRAWKKMADQVGLEATEKEFYLYEGRTGASTINILFNRNFCRDATDREIKDLYGLKSRIFTMIANVEPMPGASDLLKFLCSKGLKCVLVTGSGQSTLIKRLDKDFPGVFAPDMRITAANTEHSKPHPDPYLKAMNIAGVTPAQSIAFENAPLGVESAARSGAFTVGVSTGPIPMEALKEAGADIVFPSMQACADGIPNLFA